MFDSTRVLEIVNAHYRTLQDLQRVHRELDRRFAGLEDATLGLILSAASGEPLLLVGPPGTAKSMLIKTFCELVGVDREGSSSRFFEYLLTPFTEPGELFGFYDAGVAWTQADRPSFANGNRDWIASAGVGARVNVFNFVIAEFNLARPLVRPVTGWQFVFNLRPGF